MKRKIVLVLLVLAMTLCVGIALSSCTTISELFGEDNNNQSDAEQGDGEQSDDEDNGSSPHTHEYGTWEIITPATCTEDGVRQHSCQCGHIETQVIPATGHSYNDSNICTECGQELEFTTGLEYELREDNRVKYYAVIGLGRSTSSDIVIPAYYSGVRVRVIGDSAFSGEDFLTSVYIPDGISTIEDEAFYYCTSITNITLPESITAIGEKAFYGCQKLHEIDIGDSGITIGNDAFTSTALYNDIRNWSNGIFSIGNHVILVTQNYISPIYTVGSQTKSIAENAFEESNVTEFIIPDNSSPTIAENALTYSEITKASVPSEYVTYLPAENVTELTIISGTVSELSDFTNLKKLIANNSWDSRYPLYNLGNLEELTLNRLPASLGDLFGENSFNGSTLVSYSDLAGDYTVDYYLPASLRKVTINSGKISEYAFCNCSMLTDLYISTNVNELEGYIVAGCTNLTNISYIGDMEKYLKMTKDFYTNSKDIGRWPEFFDTKLYNSDGDEITEIAIPYNITSIGDNTFHGCSSLKNITIPDSVTSIGDNAFYDCIALKNITIPDSVTSIGDSAFENCISFTSIIIPNSISSIGSNAFSGCNNIIEIENNISYVDKWIIDCDSAVKSVTMRTDVVGIAKSAFRDRSSLTDITIPDSVIFIGAYAFWGCSSLTNITIPDSVTSIGYYAFTNCSSLTSITIPNSVTSIGSNTFESCTSLENITIGDGVTSISESAFRSCNSLTSVTIGDSVTSIEKYAFIGCNSLTSITIPDSVTFIGDWAFENCDSLETVYYTGSVEQWNNINIWGWNSDLTNANIVYNYEG